MQRSIVSALAGIALLIPSLTQAATWKSDSDHASIQFAVSHYMVSTVRGNFDKFDVTVIIDDTDMSKSSVEVTIDVASVNTRNEKRDGHLKSPDFFNVAEEANKTMTFKSKKVEKVSDTEYNVTGDFTLMGVTKEVVLNVKGSPKAMKDPHGNNRMGGIATTMINRTDYGLKYNSVLDTGGVMIGEEIEITIDLELVQEKEEKEEKE